MAGRPSPSALRLMSDLRALESDPLEVCSPCFSTLNFFPRGTYISN